MVGFILMVTSQ